MERANDWVNVKVRGEGARGGSGRVDEGVCESGPGT